MKIATWNINSVKLRINLLLDFINDANPDLILLQEIKCETDKFPSDALSHLPYNLYIHGQKSYNGVAILSKYKADEIKYDFEGNPSADASRFLEIGISSPIGFCRVISLYAPNGGEVNSDKFNLKFKFYDALTQYLIKIKTFDEKIIIGGDFNIAPFDIDVHSPIALSNSTGFTIQERQKLRTLLNSGFDDLYRICNPNKNEFSWWDYRAGAFEQNKGMRIDMILSSSNATSYAKDSYMEYPMRSKYKPSDHVPVLVTMGMSNKYSTVNKII
jgi:exodeoxyribonuclease III